MFAHPAREWIIPPPDGVASRALIDTLGISPLTAAVLVARGAQTFDEAGAALNQEGGTCPDPFLLSGMEHAVDRLRQAVVNRERIVVYGDYDVDGACATALYLGLFNALGHSAEFYIPQRLKEGYGLNLDDVRRIAAAGTSLRHVERGAIWRVPGAAHRREGRRKSITCSPRRTWARV